MNGPVNFGRQVATLARAWRTELDNRLRPLGLSQARWLLLVHLHEAPDGMAQLDLADRANVTGPTLVKQIDQLEAAGLVARREHPGDRRIKRVCLTAEGQAKFAEVDAVARSLRLEVLDGEDSHDVLATMELLRRLTARFDALATTPTEGAA